MWPEARVYWSERTRGSERTLGSPLPPLQSDLAADAVVVGGGIAGLSAAERLCERGARVVLLEADLCGQGATGRSSGFITPDSELQVADLVHRLGESRAQALYGAVRAVCADMLAFAQRHGLDCDLVVADSMYAAGGPRAVRTIRAEHEARVRLGLDSALLLDGGVRAAVATDAFPAAVRYGGTFGLDGAAFAAGKRDVLRARSVEIYERSPALQIGPGRVRTERGSVRADKVVVAVDHVAPSLGVSGRAVYRTAAWLLLTEPLGEATMQRLFPGGPVMVWDTDLVYHYLRPVSSDRLLVGGGSLLGTYASRPGPDGPVYDSIAAWLASVFPALRDARFSHSWRGLIGVSKDILPLAGPVPGVDGVYCALAGAGLPWAALAGQAAADLATGAQPPFDETLLDPGRAFSVLDPLQPLLGRRWTWTLANLTRRKLERGGPERVAARQRALALAAGLGAAGLSAALWGAWG